MSRGVPQGLLSPPLLPAPFSVTHLKPLSLSHTFVLALAPCHSFSDPPHFVRVWLEGEMGLRERG